MSYAALAEAMIYAVHIKPRKDISQLERQVITPRGALAETIREEK
jgi:hypothetical protein